MTPGSPPPSIARCSAPSRSYVLASLRALHLDRACAPAVSWQLRRTSHHQDQLYAGLHTSRGSPIILARRRTGAAPGDTRSCMMVDVGSMSRYGRMTRAVGTNEGGRG